ncbi:beta-lactamase [Candidatus Moduliflexus flocculans]|uniref:Beta-lactamase n=1 Tax=Candidatus Moduliflexus flocculans TaxID=1499966 RepID=A0A081BMF5_9BACT|nr:beta-lactamase [Candidatus Moduliflexus flocculans]
MKLFWKRYILLVLVPSILLINLTGCKSQTPTREQEAARLAVEQGLLPVFTLQGQPLPAMSLAQRMQDYHIPGVSIAVVNKNSIAWTQAYGVADAVGKQPVTAETRFQAASISKLLTAIMVMMFVQDGKIGLDEDVDLRLKSWHFPANEFIAAQPVTTRRLLSHSAGINVPNFPGYAVGEPLPTLPQILNGQPPAKTPAIEAQTQPGSVWQYSDGGYAVVQQLLEDLSGQSFAQLAQERLLALAGMTHSTFAQPLPNEVAASASSGHRVDGMPVEKRWYVYPEAAAEGLWTTPSDLARLMIELRQAMQGESAKLLSKDMAKSLLVKQIGNSAFVGPVKGEGNAAWFSAGGSTAGFRCLMVMFPELGQGAVVMTNSENGHFLAMEIMRGIARVYNWPDFRAQEKQTMPLTSEAAQRYVGTYTFDTPPGMVLTVASTEKGLSVELTGQQFEMYPETEVDFFEPISGMTITFIRQADDKPIEGLFLTPPLSSQRWAARKQD